jgi:hypothetical protein
VHGYCVGQEIDLAMRVYVEFYSFSPLGSDVQARMVGTDFWNEPASPGVSVWGLLEEEGTVVLPYLIGDDWPGLPNGPQLGVEWIPFDLLVTLPTLPPSAGGSGR